MQFVLGMCLIKVGKKQTYFEIIHNFDKKKITKCVIYFKIYYYIYFTNE